MQLPSRLATTLLTSLTAVLLLLTSQNFLAGKPAFTHTVTRVLLETRAGILPQGIARFASKVSVGDCFQKENIYLFQLVKRNVFARIPVLAPLVLGLERLTS